MLLITRIYIHLITGENSILYSPSELSWRCRTANITFMFASVADLSKFKGGGLGFRRCYAKSYEVRAFLFFLFESYSRTFRDYESWKVVKSREKPRVTSATNNRISPLLLRVTRRSNFAHGYCQERASSLPLIADGRWFRDRLGGI